MNDLIWQALPCQPARTVHHLPTPVIIALIGGGSAAWIARLAASIIQKRNAR
jgi:hypothetical protein